MLTPSYSEVMDVLNRDCDKEHRAVTSRYSIVIAASKRARQIVAGSPFDATGIKTDKAVSIAIGEISRGLVHVYPDGCDEPEPTFRPELQDNESAYRAYYGEQVSEPAQEGLAENHDEEALAETEDESEWDVSEGVV